MTYTPPGQPFVDNSNPIGGGQGGALDAPFFAALVAGVDDADTRITAGDARITTAEARVTAVEGSREVNAKGFGATGDGTTDDTAALAAFLSSGASSGYIPPGVYVVSSTLVQPTSMSVTLAPGATIRASVVMPTLWEIGDLSTRSPRRTLQGGTFDCANLAVVGLSLRYFSHFRVSNCNILSPTGDGIVVGDPASPFPSYEAVLTNIWVGHPSTDTVTAGSRGLWVRNATDGEYNNIVVVGFDTGVRVDTWSNRFIQIHAWGYPAKFPTQCFDDNGNRNTWIGCEADTPSATGFLLRGKYTNIFGGRVYCNSSGTDNTIVGVSTSQTSPTFTAIGLTFEGSSTTFRLATDFAGAGGVADSTMIGIVCTNVVTVTSAHDTFAGVARFTKRASVQSTDALAFAVRDGNAANTPLGVNTTSKIVSFNNATTVIGYAGSFATPTFSFNAGTGAVRPGTSTGLGSSLYSGSGVPDGALGAAGDFYFRYDTPGVVNQRLYVKAGGTWTSIL